jgi:hypothetical protein
MALSTECSYAQCHKQALYAEYDNADCSYARCHYADCRGTIFNNLKKAVSTNTAKVCLILATVVSKGR